MKNIDALVSIIVPVYNVERYLNRCVDSIRNQTYKKLEIILVESQSPDNCARMCDDIQNEDDRVVVLHEQINRGQWNARNVGLDAAHGEWICFVDADDFVDLRFVEELLTAAVYNKCMMVRCYFKEVLSGMTDVRRLTNRFECFDWFEFIIDSVKNWAFSNVWSYIYHRSVLSDVRFLEFLSNEDVPFVPYAIEAARAQGGKFGVTNSILYYYCLTPDSCMRGRATYRWLDFFKAPQVRDDFYRTQMHPNEVDLADFLWEMCFSTLVHSYTMLSRDLPQEHDKYVHLYGKIEENLEKSKVICPEHIMLPPNAKKDWLAVTNYEKKMVLYGYGKNGRSLLPWLLYFNIPILEIWDKAATGEQSIEGIPLRAAHEGLENDVKILISVGDRGTETAIKRMLRQMGYCNFVANKTLDYALKYAKFERFLPFILEEGFKV